MKKLVMTVALALCMSQAAGCIISSDEDEGFILVEWQLTAGDVDITCADAEADTVEVDSLLIGGNLVLEDLFDCVDGAGETGALPVGLYDVEVFAVDRGVALEPGVVTTDVDVFDGVVTDIGLVLLDVGFPAFR